MDPEKPGAQKPTRHSATDAPAPLQHGAAVIPTSRSPERSASNAALFNFALSEADMAELSGLAWFLAAPGNTPHVAEVWGIE